MEFDPNQLQTFGPQPKDPSILRDYMTMVANRPAMLAYKREFQYGGKKGEPLFTHILNGVMLLHALQRPLDLSDSETRLLMSVFTVHDINKDRNFSGRSFSQIAVPENFAHQIEQFDVAQFFPEVGRYLADIVSLARDHGGHSTQFASLGAFPRGGIDHGRLRQLLSLIQAVDIIDLSHSLGERAHKASFLSAINRFANRTQYRLYTHQISENRGTLSNLIHAAVVERLREEGAYPLLYYPDGVVYLVEEEPQLTPALQTKMAQTCAEMVNDMTGANLAEFIGKDQKQGIKVDPKVLALVSDFGRILTVIDSKVQVKNYKVQELGRKIAAKTEQSFATCEAAVPQAAEEVRLALVDPDTLLPNSDRLRLAELIRSYYIFLNDHFSEKRVDTWEVLYDLLDLPTDRRAFLSYFEARYNRPYVLMRDFHLSYDEVYDRLQEDGQKRLESLTYQDEKAPLFREYLSRYVLFGLVGQAIAWGESRFRDHLHHYVTHQHKQCAQCSAVFATDKWMANDVRSDITVQTFSNRLRGGPGEPKKYVCTLCQLQFLVERLNYEEVRGEKTMYLHFFPYSFLPMPYVAALQDDIEQIRGKDTAVRALWCDTRQALIHDRTINPDFLTRTKKNKAHTFGLYMPRVRNTVGNRIVLPLNPAGDNDSERFLFALWHGLVLQEHLGLKVMLTEASTAPFIPESDFYVDNVVLSCTGLMPHNHYENFVDYKAGTKGTLAVLREQAKALHRIQNHLLTTSSKDEILALVQAMSGGGLKLFYAAEKLLEAKIRDRNLSAPEWGEIRLAQQLLPDLERLAHPIGGTFMTQMSNHLQALAEIAWQGRLRGNSLKKNSLMTPLDEIFKKIGQRSQAFDIDALKAATCEDIFAYFERIADEYKPGKKKHESIVQFVELFFEEIYKGIYKNSLTKLLADEKMIRSAFIFYTRQQISSKRSDSDSTAV